MIYAYQYVTVKNIGEEKEAATLVVSREDGPFRSIGEAVRAAAEGAIIRVRPGIYREALVLDKAAEIVGEGQAIPPSA